MTLTQAQMLDAAYGFNAIVTCAEYSGGVPTGVTRTVDARAMIAAGNWRYWLEGDVCTAVIIEAGWYQNVHEAVDGTINDPRRNYDFDFGDGSKALHPIIEAWFYPQNNKVHVGVCIENCWCSYTASKGMRDLAYGFHITAGYPTPVTPTILYGLTPDEGHTGGIEYFTHLARSRWHRQFWIGAAPDSITVDHNMAYLISTNALPHYDTSFALDESAVFGRWGTWVAHDKTVDGGGGYMGSYRLSLDDTGPADQIGLLPTWETIYLYSMADTSNRMLTAMLGSADLAGRYTWNFREADTQAGYGNWFDAETTGSVETFGHVVSVNARTTVSLENILLATDRAADKINTPTLAVVFSMNTSHMPDAWYLPYMITGRHYYLEGLMYQASFAIGHYNGGIVSVYARQGSWGILKDSQLRGSAWAMRTAAYAAFLTPDAYPEQAYFIDKIKNTIAYYEGRYNVTNSYAAKSSIWTWARANQSLESPLGAFMSESFYVQWPLKTDGSVTNAEANQFSDYFLMSYGMARQLGFLTGNILQLGMLRHVNNMLNPDSIPYLLKSYRLPVTIASPAGLVADWLTFTACYTAYDSDWEASIQDGEQMYGELVARAALTFCTPYTVGWKRGETPVYSGLTAYNTLNNAIYSGILNEFRTGSPKWALVP